MFGNLESKSEIGLYLMGGNLVVLGVEERTKEVIDMD